MATTNQSVTAPHILRRQQGQIPVKTPEKNLGKNPGNPPEQYSEKHPKEQFGAEQFRTMENAVKRDRYFAQKTIQKTIRKTAWNMTGQTSASPTARHQACHQARNQNFAHLRRQIAVLDGRMARPRLALGIAGLDSALAGGLALGRVHMLCANWAGAHGALTGFAICLLRQLLASNGLAPNAQKPDQALHTGGAVAGRWGAGSVGPAGPVVWCPASHDAAGGMLYAAGLAALGLDPSRLLIVDTPNPARRLAVLEDILRTDGLAAVVAEYDGTRQSADYWMRLARRTQLAAEASKTTGFLLGWPGAASGFESLWHVAPAPDDSSAADATWNSVWDVDLKQVRGGRPYSLRLAWDPLDNRLAELPARPSQLTLGQLTPGQPVKPTSYASPAIPDGSNGLTGHQAGRAG